jgi:hypothetical protein
MNISKENKVIKFTIISNFFRLKIMRWVHDQLIPMKALKEQTFNQLRSLNLLMTSDNMIMINTIYISKS